MKYIFVLFISFSLFSCVPSLNPETGLFDNEPTRVISVAVNSNIPNAAKLYVIQTGPKDLKIRSSSWTKSYDRPLAFTDNLTVLDSDLKIGASPINKRYSVNPSSVSVPRGVNSFSQYFTITDNLPQLTADCQSFDQQGKREIVSALNAYEVAINSPRFLAASKLAEGKALVDDLFLRYSDRRDSVLFKKLSDLSTVGDVAASGANLGLGSLGIAGDVDFLKGVCGL